MRINDAGQLFQGSLLISYDTNTVATGTYYLEDYQPVPENSLQFYEPGTKASEEGSVLYEDTGTFHPNRLRIKQDTYMWEEDSLLLIKYTFQNPHDYAVTDLFLGQFMVFNITGVGNPANSNAMIASQNAHGVPAERFAAMTALDHNRAQSQLAKKAGVSVTEVTNVTIWGNHSNTQYPDAENAKIGGKPAYDVISDHD